MFGAEAFGELYFAEGPGPLGAAVAGFVTTYSVAAAAAAVGVVAAAAARIGAVPAAAATISDELGGIPT